MRPAQGLLIVICDAAFWVGWYTMLVPDSPVTLNTVAAVEEL